MLLAGPLPIAMAVSPNAQKAGGFRPAELPSLDSASSFSKPPRPIIVVKRVQVEPVRTDDSAASLVASISERPVTSVTTNILAPSGTMPANVAAGKMAELATASYESVTVRQWGGLQYCWDAPVLYHKPLYFEEVNLERHGYGPKHLRALQPVVSGAHFFATVPTLPYRILAEPPCQPVYTLGHYRPGSCGVPYRVNCPPLSVRGGLAETGAAIGLLLLIP